MGFKSLTKKDLKMNRERIGKTNHKVPKFKEFDDASLRWEEKIEIKKFRRKRRHKRTKLETEY